MPSFVTGYLILLILVLVRTSGEFRISNYQLMMDLIDMCLTKTVDEILATADVKERVDLYREHEPKAKEQIKRCATVHNNLVVLDLRPLEGQRRQGAIGPTPNSVAPTKCALRVGQSLR